MRDIVTFLKSPSEFSQGIVRKLFANRIIDDKRYLSLLYFATFGNRMNWNNPQTFNEKLTWLKVYNRKSIYSTMVDKFSVKKYVADIIGEEYVVENYGVYDSWDNIDFGVLPNQFVLKSTHDSGGAFICEDKSKWNPDSVKKQILDNLNKYNYNVAREWPYKNVPHRIIIDKYLNDHTGKQLRDYKFWCFNGVPQYMYCTIKAKRVFENFYDMDFNPVMINHGFPRHKPEFSKPANFELMKNLAKTLSKDIPFVRVDFFDVDGQVFFGEFTFFDWGGKRPFKGDWDRKLGALINLPI